MMVRLSVFRTSCAQQTCSKCEAVDDFNVDSKECGERTHVFWAEEPVGKFVAYLRRSRPVADNIGHIT